MNAYNKDLLQVGRNIKALNHGSVKGANEGFGAEGQENELKCQHCGKAILHFVDVRVDGALYVVGKSCYQKWCKAERDAYIQSRKAVAV
jgi:hypothetical protein